MTQELWQMSAVDLADGIRTKAFSSVEVVSSVVERIRLINPGLNAIVYDYGDQALVAASEADSALARGASLGPLHGVPVTIKVNVDVEGTPNTNGMKAFENVIAPGNSPIVQNFLNAGAIVVGKTNTPELSMRATTDNPLHGLTHSPWDERASPGGSSGGAGAACAAGMGPIHHGNDIGGSLRFPASACGCATVKPGLGRVAAYNPSAPAERGLLAQLMSVQGVICREVKDVRLATRVAAEADPRDPWWCPVPFDGPQVSKPIKVAIARDRYGYPIHPEIEAGLQRAAGYLSEAGYAVEEANVPSVEDAARGWFSYAVLEIKETLGPFAEANGSPTIQNILGYYYEMAETVDFKDYFGGVANRTAIVRRWSEFLAQYPLVLSPFLMRPTIDYDYDETFEGAKDIFDASIYGFSMNFMGLPAGNVPIGLVEGRPCGVQIVGQRFREDLILDALEAIERQVGVLTKELWVRD